MQTQSLIKIVQRSLWSRGYRVKVFADTVLGFDLLVEGKFRVRVRTKGRDTLTPNIDVIVDAEEGTGAFKGKFRIVYHNLNGSHLSPSHVFGLPTKSRDKTYGKKEGKEGRKKGGKKAAAKGSEA